MLRYALGSLALTAVVIAGLFALVAWRNGDPASSGPLPTIVITADDAGVTPERVELREDQLAELRLVNNASLHRAMSASADNVLQLPLESPVYDPHSIASGVPYISIQASSGTTASALVRFRESGEYELRVEAPGKAETLRLVTVKVR